MDSMEVLKYERDGGREWRYVEKVADLPGGCRPIQLNPIIVEMQSKNGGPIIRRRLRANGFIDAEERFGYVLKKNLERVVEDEITATDTFIVFLNDQEISLPEQVVDQTDQVERISGIKAN